MGPSFELTGHLIQAVTAGLGIGLVPQVLVTEELASGQLVQLFEPVQSKRNYFLVYPPRNEHLPSLQTFRNWLLQDFAAHDNRNPA
jgi:DNA-binding transcriptional LysR family regulator